jgi:methylase of polypeptide subunit release factors
VESIYTSYQSNNDLLIERVASLYFKDGDSIADVTYGKGVFWRAIDTTKYQFHPSDLLTCPNAQYDFRKLPYDDNTMDVVVFDPPYVHDPGSMLINDNYKNKETTKGFRHKDIINLYREGMTEAIRLIKTNGLLLVKCKDGIECSKQYMSHIEIHDIAITELKLFVQDLFILTQKNDPIIQHKVQHHARKNHSYLWVFGQSKPGKRRT